MAEITRSKTNVVILITGEAEYRIMRRHFNNLQEEVHATGTIYERGDFPSVAGRASAALSMESGNNIATASETERALNYYIPDVVLSVGEADGIMGVSIGDVVVANKVYHYEPTKEEGLTPLTMPEIGNPGYRARERARSEARKPDWLRRLPGAFAYPAPQVILAPLAAGSKILASRKATPYILLRTHFNDAVAVDTQGYGFLQAVHANQSRQYQSALESLIVRGIKDMLQVPPKSSTRAEQTMAAERACAFAFHVLTTLQLTTRNPHLERGQEMLQVKDYPTARQELHQAIKTIHRDSPEEAAQARYLLTLAILGTQLPRVKGEETMQVVEQLLATALQLHALSSYYWSLALLQEDYFTFNGLRSRLGEIAHLEYQAAHTPWNNESDTANMRYFQACQPELFRRLATKTGRTF
ncbi:MAG TPA: hypothetical protein VGF67_19560 [Ktedonobacteraceae bacterium]|jgi:nucleoside phosphorylase